MGEKAIGEFLQSMRAVASLTEEDAANIARQLSEQGVKTVAFLLLPAAIEVVKSVTATRPLLADMIIQQAQGIYRMLSDAFAQTKRSIWPVRLPGVLVSY
jgi:hypothetical protein